MTTPRTSAPSAAVDSRLAEVLAEAAQRLQSGQPVDPADYAARCPECAERLAQLLPAMQTLAELGHSQSSTPSSSIARADKWNWSQTRTAIGR